ncbi:MAG: PHP domain-containing protein [Oscillospiraceae bacterium]|nr:PHP domain-containing protein [Oscillospiraceae bacterium]
MMNLAEQQNHNPGETMSILRNTVDLHIHSNYSDGSATPAEIVELAAASGLRYIALTDHDTVDGIREILQAAASINTPTAFQTCDTPTAVPATHTTAAASATHTAAPLKIIPGVEISADYKKPLHIIGYFRPDNYDAIAPFLVEMKRARHERNLGVIEKLNSLGIRMTAEEVADIAGKEIFGRPHIAAALVRRGVVQNLAGAFNEYLAGGRKAYVAKRSLPPEECVQAIAEAGGLPVIAHPSQTGMRLGEIEELARSLAAHGLYGIEAYYADHTPKETSNYLELAHKLNLSATGGSDYHGEYRKNTHLGTGKDGALYIPEAAALSLLSSL